VIDLEIDFERTVQDLFEYLGEVIDVEGQHCRLIIGGKSFVLDSDLDTNLGDIIKPGGTAMLVATPSEQIKRVREARSDPLVKSFEAEDRDNAARIEKAIHLMNDNPWGAGATQHPEFCFERFEVLFKRIKPPPFEAEKLLKKLALDPGIVEIMTQRRFNVNTLCELDPLDADIEQAEKGEGDKCLLGWNRNFGQRIALRLRTDDFTSFRKYDSIINTLIHELVHNVHANHDSQFWTLFRELKEQYSRHHSRRRTATVLQSDMAPLGIPRAADAQQQAYRRIGGTAKVDSRDELREARLKALDKNRKR
jgi:hypothetical protein